MPSNQIKSKQRIRDHGEVFTPEHIVNDMLDLVRNETEIIESRFLEPACGDGNFLAPILERKIEMVKKRYRSSQIEFERMALLAIGSIYGVELLHDNVETCIERLYKIVDDAYTRTYKNESKDDFRKSVRFVLCRNILHGDALNLKNPDSNKYLVFSEWSLVNGSKIKRRDFEYRELANFDPQKPTLFSIRQVSDTGEAVFLPMPKKDFPLMHYLKLKYEDA